MKLKTLILFLSLSAGALTCQAGLTARASVLVNSPNDIDVSSGSNFKTSLDNGAGFSLGLGYDISAFRLEAEAIYFKNDVGDSTLTGSMTDGDLKRVSLWGNVFMDLPLPILDPYIGVGVGWGNADLNYKDAGSSSVTVAENESFYGAQFMTGVRFGLFDTLNAGIGYRYMILDGVDYSDGASSISYDGGEHYFEVTIGLGF